MERTGGFETIAFCEIDPFPCKVLQRHWPNVPIFEDVKNVTANTVSELGHGMPEVITGGFPCQDLSSAGRRAGITGERSGLWGELFRIMCEIRPRFTIFENVTGLLSGDGGGWFSTVLSDLAEGGFILEWECIPASSVGMPHIRDRVYGIAYPNENGWLRIFSQANFKKRRDLGNNLRADGLFGGKGVVSNWEREKGKSLPCEPLIARKNDGVSGWMDRNSSLGNSIVPQIATIIGESILEVYR